MAVRSAHIPIIPGSGNGMHYERPAQPAWTDADEPRLPRSASYTHIPETLDEKSSYDEAPPPTFNRARSDGRLPQHDKERFENGSYGAGHQSSPSTSSIQRQRTLSGFTTMGKSNHKNGAEKGQLKGNVPYESTVAGAQPRTGKPPHGLRKSRFRTSGVSSLEETTVPYDSTIAGAPPRMEARPLAKSDLSSDFSKRSTNSSRSSSLLNLDEEGAKVSAASINLAAAKLKNARQGIPSVNTSSRPRSPERLSRKMSRSQNSQSNDSRKPMNGIFKSITSESSSLSRSSSTNSRDRSKIQPSPSNSKPKSVPIVLNMPNNSQPPKPIAKRKVDELARPIRLLETEFEKFEAGSVTSKANTVRTILVPFLRNYAQHNSHKTIAPEDLDRRIKIFDKWWRGILHTINADEACAISWTDRHMLLEAIAGLMSRPEWRLPPSDCSPLKDRYSSTTPRSDSSTSLDSDNDFLIESVHHNMRTMFVSNLSSQMAFAVSTLSQRSTPPSTVSFGGKTAAYAFFFCPGVADAVIRSWKTPLKAYQRVLDEFGIPPRYDFSGKNEDIVRGFPRCIRGLRYTSFGSTVRRRRSLQEPIIPLSSDKIDWDGPWVTRWVTGDTDLFFVFVKHYHNLLSEFLPPGIGDREHICCPGFLQIHAQMLVAFDHTIQCQSPSDEPLTGPSPVTFDDVLEGADTTAAALQLPLAGLAKEMAENRLVVLLREFLSEFHSPLDNSRQVFTRTFSLLMKAAAKRTSMFDQTACFALCEFMEEAFFILLRYQQDSNISFDLIDWPFWQIVCQKMVSSHNSMTEIRVFAFLYNIWGVLTKDEKRKEQICLDWLLTESTFEQLFQHWCPMNRSYYMRLLCWRLARFDGTASEVNVKIYAMLFTRLRNLWAQFQCLQETLKALHIAPADTSPAPPAPGRKFLIIRTDFPRPTPAAFLEFEGINLGRSNSSIDEINSDETINGKKSWKMLRNFMGMTNGASIPPALPPPTIAEPSLRPKPVSRQNSKERPPPPSSFKFSLDWLNRPQSLGRPRNLLPPRLPTATDMLLRSRPGGAFDTPLAVKPDAVLQIQSLKYAGRALAEWSLVVGEYQGFLEKRLREGVINDKAVETPSLTVENFKRIGG